MKYTKLNLANKAKVNGAAKVLVENYNIKTPKEAIQAIKEEVDHGFNYIIAENNNGVIGISCWAVHGLPKHKVIQTGRVAVLSEFKGKGIATELFMKSVQDAHKFYKSKKLKLRKLYAYVHASNRRARDFYENLGLVKEAILKDHYYKNENEYMYSMFFE